MVSESNASISSWKTQILEYGTDEGAKQNGDKDS